MSLKTAALGLAVLGGLTLSDARAEGLQQATLGGGCFWCLEAVYEELTGVTKVESGYAGGRTVDPTYQDICGGDTGHAEVVQVTFDPAVTSYADILGVFFTVHDPTTLNRQGADAGTQYRSAVFVHNDDQRRTAEDAVDAVNESGAWTNRVVTEVTPLHKFYRAEDYHQNYYARNTTQGYCQVVINPKLAKFREKFAAKLKKSS
ncbi:MAG: peptide-methionine (S)-S-oxide reductase MsrA [bacterium]|nr:peptide-methionine (S)-S-oxide reductase MsrA [bacterium]